MYLNRKSRKDEDIADDVQLCYWRKANQVHKFFVKDAEETNCVNFPVRRADIKQLVADCESVLADNSRAEELLPTGTGFFFGSYDYDSWYFKQLEETVQDLKEVLDDWELTDQVYYYAWF